MLLQSKAVVGAIAAMGLATTPCALCGTLGSARLDQTPLVSVQVVDTATVRLHISGLTCGSCATTARLALKKLDGVLDATVSAKDSLGVVRYDPRKVDPPRIVEHLARLTGYEARVISEPGRSE